MAMHIRYPTEVHQLTVIFLHSGDEDGESLEEELLGTICSDQLLLVEALPFIKWIFPTASAQFLPDLTHPANWFERVPGSSTADNDEPELHGLRESINEIHRILRREVEQVGYDRVAIGGIGRGCAVAAHALLSYGGNLAGFIGLCGWAPFNMALENITRTRDRSAITRGFLEFYTSVVPVDGGIRTTGSIPWDTPVFMGYTLDDEIVPYEESRRLLRILWQLGMPCEIGEYQGCGNWVQEPDGIDDIAKFLTELTQ